jgi:hypothetical protein
MKLLLAQFFRSNYTFSALDPSVSFSILFSEILNISSCLNEGDQTGKIIDLYSPVFMFIVIKREDESFWTER